MKGNTYTLACWVCFSSPFAEAKITFSHKKTHREEKERQIYLSLKKLFSSLLHKSILRALIAFSELALYVDTPIQIPPSKCRSRPQKSKTDVVNHDTSFQKMTSQIMLDSFTVAQCTLQNPAQYGSITFSE